MLTIWHDPSMASTLVWRIVNIPESGLTDRLKHIRGTKRSPVTREFEKRGIDLCEMAHGVKYGVKHVRGSEVSPAARHKLRAEAEELVKRQRGVKPEPWCELVVVGGKVIDWPPKKAEEWATAVLRERKRLMPDAVVVLAALHGDESEWHMHIAMQPRARDSRGRIRLGQTAMRRGMDAIVAGEPVRDRVSKGRRKSGSSALLTHLHDTIGKQFGLLRGKEGSNREHQEIDPYEAVQARLREVTRLRERVRLELEAAEKKRADAENDRAEVAELKWRYHAIEEAEAELAAKVKAAEARLKKREAETEAKEARLAKQDKVVRERYRRILAQEDMIDGCIDDELDMDATKEALLTIAAGKPLTGAAKVLYKKRLSARREAAKRRAEAKEREPLAGNDRVGRKRGERAGRSA